MYRDSKTILTEQDANFDLFLVSCFLVVYLRMFSVPQITERLIVGRTAKKRSLCIIALPHFSEENGRHSRKILFRIICIGRRFKPGTCEGVHPALMLRVLSSWKQRHADKFTDVSDSRVSFILVREM
jgi:hypothetical protein